MSERSIVVRFKAEVADLKAKTASAASSIKSVADAADQASAKAGSGFSKIGTGINKGLAGVSKHKDSINTLANGFLTLGVAAAGGVAVATKKFADFDEAMSHVKATGADARASLDALRQAAIDAGASTAFSATEAAQGIENLLKAGVSAKDVLGGGLQGALDLAAAGGTDVAFAAEAAATAMSQFGLKGKDVTHIADLLAQSAGTAQGEVSDMAMALKQSGSVAAQFGLSIDETTQALAVFAKEGGIGSDAGTAFKTMLMSLYAPSGSAAKTLDQLGISAYDASGALKPIGEVLDDLRSRLDTLSEGDRNKALVNLFGTDGIRAANALLKDGSVGLRNMSDEFDKFGSAADVAGTRMDNLKGDIEALSGAMDTAFIGAGSGGNDFLRSVTQGATDMVNEFNRVPDSVQQGTLAVAGTVAVTALAAGGLAKLAVAAAETRAALMGLGIMGPRAAAAMTGVAGAAGPVAVALLGVAAAGTALNSLDRPIQSVNDLEASLRYLAADLGDVDAVFSGSNFAGELMGSLTTGIQPAKDLQSAMVGLAASQDTWIGKVSRVREALTPGMQSFERAEQQVGSLDQALAQMVAKGDTDQAVAALAKLGVTSEQVARFFPQYAAALDASKGAGEASAAGSGEAAIGAQKAGEAAAQAAAEIKKQTDAMYAAANGALAMSGNQIAVEAAMDAAAKSVKENGKTLDINTEKGRANQQALNDLASATLTTTQAMVDAGNVSATKIVATNERAKESYIKTAQAMGMSKSEARDMADALFQIPTTVSSQVVIAGAKVSKAEAKELNQALKDIPPEKRAEIVTIAQTKGAKAAKQAMAEVKDKEVIARSKGDLKGAKEVKSAMAALKDRLVKAVARGDKKGADQVRAAMAALRDKTVTARVKADTSGVAVARGEMGRLQDRTVWVNIRERKLKAEGGPVFRSHGGPVWGAGTATSDSIPAMLSNGEFVIKASSVQMLGVDRLMHMNRTGTLPGFAAGGAVGSGIPANVDFARIWALITAVTRPLAAIQAAQVAMLKATSVKAKEDREAAAAKKAYDKAVAADKRADAEVKRDGSKADKKRARETEKAKDKAEAAYKKQLDQAKDATSKLTDATRNLRDAQQQLADSARAQSDALADPYRSKSTDIDDWLESLRTGATDLKAFQGQILQLRKLGVSETIIQQIADQGAVVGSELAGQIIEGGKALAGALNQANGNLQKAADGLGYDIVQASGRYATGGMITGPGTGTSDSILARVSAGEWIVPARAVQGNLGLLRQMTYGDSSHVPGYARGGMVQPHYSKHIRQGDQYVTITGPDPDAVVRKMRNAQRDALAMVGIR